MLVFVDFEASSLAKHSYPIEVAWVFEDGRSEAHLIRPAEGWDDWDGAAEAIHRISRAQLRAEGAVHDEVARRMVDQLSGHDLFASAPSWDGKWLSVLLRAAGFPRHTLRLRASDCAQRECAAAILSGVVAGEALAQAVEDVLAPIEVRGRRESPAHRALPDAMEERARWLAVRDAATAMAGERAAAG